MNPEALTPWKAEMLWQLFVATSNHFSRTLDRDRLHASDEAPLLEQVRAAANGADNREIERFLEGFPRRYLAVHTAPEIASHFHVVSQARRRTGPDGHQENATRLRAHAAFRGPPGSVRHHCRSPFGLGHEHREG